MLDLRWRTPFETVVPGQTVAGARAIVAARPKPRRFGPTQLKVRVRGNQIKASYFTGGQASTTPILHGTMSDGPDGLHLQGSCSWSLLLLQLFSFVFYVGASLFLAAWLPLKVITDDWGLEFVWFATGSLLAGLFLLWLLRRNQWFSRDREQETAQLRSELHRLFAPGA